MRALPLTTALSPLKLTPSPLAVSSGLYETILPMARRRTLKPRTRLSTRERGDPWPRELQTRPAHRLSTLVPCAGQAAGRVAGASAAYPPPAPPAPGRVQGISGPLLFRLGDLTFACNPHNPHNPSHRSRCATSRTPRSPSPRPTTPRGTTCAPSSWRRRRRASRRASRPSLRRVSCNL